MPAGCRPTATPAPVNSAPAVRPAGAAIQWESSAAIRAAKVVYDNGSSAGRNAILESLGGGVAVVDYDHDGQLDLCFPAGGSFVESRTQGLPTRLMRQRGLEQFDDVGSFARLAVPRRYSHGCSVADYNNDGFADLLITGFGGLTLWENLGDGTFADVTQAAALDDASWSSSAAWCDVNNDGVPDLYVAHYVNWSFDNDPPCQGPAGSRDVCPPRQFDGLDDVLYLGQGDGVFRNATATAGLSPQGKGLGVLVYDVDDDGDQDIYVANDTVPNFLYLNRGDATFEEQGMLAGAAVDDMASPNGSMGLAVTDYDGDGKMDLFVTNYEDELFALYRNLGSATFQHVSRRTGLNRLGTLFVGFGCVAADLDADGDEDIAVANGHVVHHPRNAPVKQSRLLLLNQSAGRFERFDPEGQEAEFSRPAIGRGVVTGDLDRDGRLDLVFSNSNEPAELFYNRSQPASGAVQGLIVRFRGVRSTRDAPGLRAELETSSGTQVRQLIGGGSYLSTSELAAIWYWTSDTQPRNLRVRWPSGAVSELPITDVPGVRQWMLLEPADASASVRLIEE